MNPIVEKAKELCCCWTYRSIGLKELCPICQLAEVWSETNEALAACQSEGGAWKRAAEEAIELLKVMPDHGLSAYDLEAWYKRRSALLHINSCNHFPGQRGCEWCQNDGTDAAIDKAMEQSQ